MGTDITASYTHRAAEYTEHLGSMTTVHPSDVQLVSSWAASVNGPLLDAGCGPGRWTAYLAGQGYDARGIDQVPAFIEHARGAYRTVPFEIGSIDALVDPARTYAGILAWYSLIHHEPSTIRQAFNEFARVLRPGGRLLIGFFLGAEIAPFDHAIVTAYQWPANLLADELKSSGFDTIETHTRTGATSRPRPHGAILAHLSAVD